MVRKIILFLPFPRTRKSMGTRCLRTPDCHGGHEFGHSLRIHHFLTANSFLNKKFESPSAHMRDLRNSQAFPFVRAFYPSPPFRCIQPSSMIPDAPISLRFSLWFGRAMNWPTQISAWLVQNRRVRSSFSVVPEVVHPPHAKPVIITTIAPTIIPQTPYLTFDGIFRFHGSYLLLTDVSAFVNYAIFGGTPVAV